MDDLAIKIECARLAVELVKADKAADVLTTSRDLYGFICGRASTPDKKAGTPPQAE